MFYAQFVLSKKGPLAKIWLAAHWEKKLTKAQIFETDVGQAVEEVMKPKVKMALRTVGHLLLGIVRIYSKKTRYLLADTNEAFIKMRLNFRAGFQIEIDDYCAQDDNENYDDVDEINMTVPEFLDIEIDENVMQQHISRLEDITLKDDINLNSTLKQLNFGTWNDDFGELADMYESYPSSSMHTPDASVLEFARDTNESLAIDKVPGNNTDIINTQPKNSPATRNTTELQNDNANNTLGDNHFDIDGDLFSSMLDGPLQVPQAVNDDLMGNCGDVDDFVENEHSKSLNSQKPLNVSLIDGKRGKRNRKPRKLIVDENTSISDDFRKKQMDDFSDTLGQITVAPPNKKTRRMCETGVLNVLMEAPGIMIRNPELLEQYKSRLIPTAYKPNLGAEAESSSSSENPWNDLGLSEDIINSGSIELGDIQNKENDEEDEADPFSISSTSTSGTLESFGFGSTVKKPIYDDSKWAKRSKHILKKISLEIENGGEVQFSSITATAKTRKHAAEQFYSLLTLLKKRAVDVIQEEPFGDIKIRAGELFNEFLLNDASFMKEEMASRVNICGVNILDNPAKFTDKFKLEIVFEVFEQLPHDLEWELVYVGSGTSSEYDQLLDSVLVGPVPEGRHKFTFDADCPDVKKIPTEDIVGVSVLLLRCKYNDQEFINLGWFVSNEYEDEEMKENPPAMPQIEKLARKIQTDSLRVTTFTIKWGEAEENEVMEEDDESKRVFDEQELMPLNDDEVDDEEEEEDDEDEDAREVDLNECIEKCNQRISKALEKNEIEDIDMECETGDAQVMSKAMEKPQDHQIDPFTDKTNNDQLME
ncbi:unnamed protein product [Caenorhabditis bovis]|uniref:Rad21/Rec8-like protein N-terminal domain-containing protein n=1 Tax=Caenorhabditis bovis TaxID=2654633 RepID=A0A8S1F5V1_9PELO|nr:unnamed protein product [Caenorhabditis bovis]